MKKIQKIDSDTFVISYNQQWLPGSFDSEETANEAFNYSEEKILNLQNEKNKTTCKITMKDLKSII